MREKIAVARSSKEGVAGIAILCKNDVEDWLSNSSDENGVV